MGNWPLLWPARLDAPRLRAIVSDHPSHGCLNFKLFQLKKFKSIVQVLQRVCCSTCYTKSLAKTRCHQGSSGFIKKKLF